VTMYRNGVLIWGTEPLAANAPNFTLAAAPTSVSVSQGASATAALTITPVNGFASAVSLTAAGMPTGVTASFAPASVTGTTSTLTLTASATATTGTFPITVTGSGNG